MQGSIQEQGSAKQTENENCTEILSKKKKVSFHHFSSSAKNSEQVSLQGIPQLGFVWPNRLEYQGCFYTHCQCQVLPMLSFHQTKGASSPCAAAVLAEPTRGTLHYRSREVCWWKCKVQPAPSMPLTHIWTYRQRSHPILINRDPTWMQQNFSKKQDFCSKDYAGYLQEKWFLLLSYLNN